MLPLSRVQPHRERLHKTGDMWVVRRRTRHKRMPKNRTKEVRQLQKHRTRGMGNQLPQKAGREEQSKAGISQETTTVLNIRLHDQSQTNTRNTHSPRVLRATWAEPVGTG